MIATVSVKDFHKYEKVITQFLLKGKGLFNSTGFKIAFNPGEIILYYAGSNALASYRMSCKHDMEPKVISTDYFRFSQILKALASEGTTEVSFALQETQTGAVIKIDSGRTHIDLPAVFVTEEFPRGLDYDDSNISCTLDDLELYDSIQTAASFLSTTPGTSVFVDSTAIANDNRYIFVAKKKWAYELEEGVSLSKQNLDLFVALKSIDNDSTFKHITSDKEFVHLASCDSAFNVHIGEPTPVVAAPTDEQLEEVASSTYLTDLTANELLSVINFFISTGIFDGTRWYPLTIQSFPKEKKLKFTVKNSDYSALPSLNVERWIDDVEGLEVEVEDTISADLLKIFLSILEDGSEKISIYTDPTSNGVRFKSAGQDLYLAKFS